MVAISLYRGNLHRVPDVPRRWLMPTPKISLKDFRALLTRRSNALRSSPAAASSNPKPDPVPQLECKKEAERGSDCEGGGEEEKEIDEENVPETGAELAVFEAKEDDGLCNLDAEDPDKEKLLDDNEKRRMREVEEKLLVLQEKKHNLVQGLKQILNAEEQLKAKRESQVMMTCRPLVSLQVDVTHDSGSMSRQVTPRMGLEPNVGGDVEAGEAEDGFNQNILSRHVRRTSSLSPSSESPLRRPFQHNVPHPSRSGFVAASSPSRFAPTAHQGNPPSISLSGTNYIASSPSPAASGGTSAFRDARHPSPWN